MTPADKFNVRRPERPGRMTSIANGISFKPNADIESRLTDCDTAKRYKKWLVIEQKQNQF